MIKGRFLWISSAALVIGALLILSYNKHDVNIRPSFKTSSMKNLHWIQKENDKIQWELSAKNAVLPVVKKEIFLESIGLKVNQSPEIYLTSGKGMYDVEKGDITLKDTVEINIKNAKFITDTLKWNSTKRIIATNDAVQLKGTKFLIKGTGLTSRVDDQKIKVRSNVKAIYYR
jgi:LPS export ABC transporter protein LptC